MTKELTYLEVKFTEFDSIVKKFYPNAQIKDVKQTMSKGKYTYLIDGVTVVVSRVFSGERFSLELISKEIAKNGKKVSKSTLIKSVEFKRHDVSRGWIDLSENFAIAMNALFEAHDTHHFTLVEIRKEDLDLIDQLQDTV